MPNGISGSQGNGLSKHALFRHPIHLRDGDSVWPANVRLLRQCDVIGKGKRFRYGVVAKRNGGAVTGGRCRVVQTNRNHLKPQRARCAERQSLLG